MQEAETRFITCEPGGVEALLIVVRNVPEAVGEPVIEALGEDRLLSLGFDEAEEVVSESGLVLGRRELSWGEFTSGKENLCHCRLQNRWPAFTGHGRQGFSWSLCDRWTRWEQ